VDPARPSPSGHADALVLDTHPKPPFDSLKPLLKIADPIGLGHRVGSEAWASDGADVDEAPSLAGPADDRFTLPLMARQNKDGKWTTFWVAKSGAGGEIDMRQIDPYDPALTTDPELAGEGAGKLRLENDDQVWVVVTLDEAAHNHAERAFRDAAALAQEHMIPQALRSRR
jgi:hypothetical protein